MASVRRKSKHNQKERKDIGDIERDIGCAKQRDGTDGNKGVRSNLWMWNNILRGRARGDVPAGSTQ